MNAHYVKVLVKPRSAYGKATENKSKSTHNKNIQRNVSNTHFNNYHLPNLNLKKKALLIGINYFGQKRELKGCINDVKNMRQLLIKYYGYDAKNIVCLTDDIKFNTKNYFPNRKNIINGMKWLVSNSRYGDALFFHFSGHGGLVKDLDGDEQDGYDQTILPVDYLKSGQILDDEMNLIMVKALPKGTRLTAIFDSCHSGTVLDLPYVYNTKGELKKFDTKKTVLKTIFNTGMNLIVYNNKLNALFSVKKGFVQLKRGKKAEEITKKTKGSLGDVIMFSGCSDLQTSADTKVRNKNKKMGNGGAMTSALLMALSSNPYGYTYLELLKEIRKILGFKYRQKPQMSSGKPMDVNKPFTL